MVAAWMKHAKGRQLSVEDLQASVEMGLQSPQLGSIACGPIEVSAPRYDRMRCMTPVVKQTNEGAPAQVLVDLLASSQETGLRQCILTTALCC